MRDFRQFAVWSPEGTGAGGTETSSNSSASPSAAPPAVEGQPPAGSATAKADDAPVIPDTFETNFENLDLAFASEADEVDTAAPAGEDKTKVAAPAAPKDGKEVKAPATAPKVVDPKAPAAPAPPTGEVPKEGAAAPEAPKEPAPKEQPKSFQEVLAAVSEKMVPELAKLYALPADVAKHWTPEQGTSMQQMAAMVHMNVLLAAAAMVENLTPRIIQQHLAASKQETASEEAFFKAWPGLKIDHLPVIQKYGKLWAQANPTGKLEDYIKQVGTMASAELGLLSAEVAPAPAAGTVPKAAAPKSTTVPFVPANVTQRSATPVRPNNSGGADWATMSDALAQESE